MMVSLPWVPWDTAAPSVITCGTSPSVTPTSKNLIQAYEAPQSFILWKWWGAGEEEELTSFTCSGFDHVSAAIASTT